MSRVAVLSVVIFYIVLFVLFSFPPVSEFSLIVSLSK